MKKELILTNQEKIEMANGYKKYLNEMEGVNVCGGIMFGMFGVIAPLTCIVLAIFHDTMALGGIGLGLGACALTAIAFAVEARRLFKKHVTKKMPYGQFKQLVKSGEVAKWIGLSNQTSQNIVVEDYVSEIPPTTQQILMQESSLQTTKDNGMEK